MNYYDILGVPRSATHDEIKAAYRKCEIIYFQLLLNTHNGSWKNPNVVAY